MYYYYIFNLSNPCPSVDKRMRRKTAFFLYGQHDSGDLKTYMLLLALDML